MEIYLYKDIFRIYREVIPKKIDSKLMYEYYKTKYSTSTSEYFLSKKWTIEYYKLSAYLRIYSLKGHCMKIGYRMTELKIKYYMFFVIFHSLSSQDFFLSFFKLFFYIPCILLTYPIHSELIIYM